LEIDVEPLRLKLESEQPSQRKKFQQLYMDHLVESFKTFKLATEFFQGDERAEEMWPTNTPADVKISFLRNVVLVPSSPKKQIVCYITTLESLNSNDDGCLLYNIQRLMATFSESSIQSQQLIQLNLAFCDLITPSFLRGTSFERMDALAYSKRIERLQTFQRQNMSLYRQIVAINDTRARGNEIDSLPRLYEDPPPATGQTRDEGLPDPAPHQELLEFLLQRGGAQLLRKNDKAVFEEVVSMPENVHTRFFKMSDEFVKWAWKCVAPPEYKYQHYCLTLRSTCESQIANMLSQEHDPRIPRLKKRRSLFSYRNGIFDAETGFFHAYNCNGYLPPYIHTVEELPTDESSAQFFDFTVDLRYFDPNFDISNIPLKKHDKILEDQDFDKHAKEAWECSFGRTLHDAGKKDNWAYAVWITGAANSGKTTILENWAKVYPTGEVGRLNDDTEESFIDQHLTDSLFVIGTDVSDELDVKATRFNMWVDSSHLVIKRKNKMALVMKWIAQLLFASNTWPGISSKAGAGMRRFVFFIFNNTITKLDTNLQMGLEEELPLAVIRYGLRYLKWVKKYGHLGIWEDKPFPETGRILPDMCYNGRSEYTKLVSPPDAFLESPTCQYDPSYTCDIATFKRHYAFFRATRTQTKGNLQGHQRGRTYNPDVSPLTFSYPLRIRGCVWDLKTNIITGLRCQGVVDSSTTRRTDQPIINGPKTSGNASGSTSSNSSSNSSSNGSPSFPSRAPSSLPSLLPSLSSLPSLPSSAALASLPSVPSAMPGLVRVNSLA